MIAGLTLPQLAQRVQELDGLKRDFLVPQKLLSATISDGRLQIRTLKPEARASEGARMDRWAEPTTHARNQLTELLSIPRSYADLLLAEQPGLLEHNLNERLQQDGNTRRTLRTYNNSGNVIGEGPASTLRAVLSDRYRPLDNFDLLAGIGELLTAGSTLVVRSSQVTETRLYIQAVRTGIEVPVHKPGTHDISDVICPGVVISNSEVGAGSLRVEAMMFRRACSNGSMWGESLRRNHVGKRMTGGGDGASEIDYSDATKQKIDIAFWAQVRETIAASMNELKFREAVGRLEPLAGITLGQPQEAVEITCKRHGLNEDEKARVLRNLIQGGDCTAYGLWNAVTHVAEEVESYDRAIEIERIGGAMLTEGVRIGRN